MERSWPYHSDKAGALRYAPSYVRFFVVLLALSQSVSAILTKCYDAAGDLRGDKPCSPDASASACCAEGWVCTNISLCVASAKIIPTLSETDPYQFEGSCTDKTWNSPDCPSFCRTGNLSENAANGVWDCGSGDWCCSAYTGDTNCCKRDTTVFYLGGYANLTTIGGAAATVSSTSSSSSSTSFPATTTQSSATSSTSAVSSTSPVITPSPTSNPGLSNGAKAGIGIGVTAGIVGLVALGFFAYRQRNSTKTLKEQIQLLAGRNDYKDPRAELPTTPPEHEFTGYEGYTDRPIPESYELSGQGTYELPEQQNRAELADERSRG